MIGKIMNGVCKKSDSNIFIIIHKGTLRVK